MSEIVENKSEVFITLNNVEYKSEDLNDQQRDTAVKIIRSDNLLAGEAQAKNLKDAHDLYVILSDYRNIMIQGFSNLVEMKAEEIVVANPDKNPVKGDK